METNWEEFINGRHFITGNLSNLFLQYCSYVSAVTTEASLALSGFSPDLVKCDIGLKQHKVDFLISTKNDILF